MMGQSKLAPLKENFKNFGCASPSLINRINMSRIDSAKTKKLLILITMTMHSSPLYCTDCHWQLTCDNHGAQFQANLVMDNFTLEFVVAHKIAARNLARPTTSVFLRPSILPHTLGSLNWHPRLTFCPTHPDVETSKALGSLLVWIFHLHFLYLKLFNPCRSPNWVVLLICSVHPILHVLKMGKSHDIWGGFGGWLLMPCLKSRSSFTIVHPYSCPKMECHIKLGFGWCSTFYSMSQTEVLIQDIFLVHVLEKGMSHERFGDQALYFSIMSQSNWGCQSSAPCQSHLHLKNKKSYQVRVWC
jgi:hypothetical protein